MGSLFNVVMLAGNNSHFLDFIPLVIKAWHRLWDVDVVIGVVYNANEEEEIRQKVKNKTMFTDGAYIGDRSWLSIYYIENVTEAPTANLAKILPYYLSCYLKYSVLLVNDLDLIPLSRWYLEERLCQREEFEIACLVCDEFYNYDATLGKFPGGDLTCEGQIMDTLCNPSYRNFTDWVNSLRHTRVFDDFEDPFNPPEKFSSESLMRVWLSRYKGKVKRIEGLVHPFDNDTIIDRAMWNIDVDKLYKGGYFEAHALRPYSENIAAIKPIEEYINSL
jgi:hypothetical protein